MPVWVTQEAVDWFNSGDDWRPADGTPTYREVLRMLGEEKARTQHLRRLLRQGLQAMEDQVMIDPLYELELRERGLL